MTDRTDLDSQRASARLAGFLFLFVLATSIAGLIVTSIAGTGPGVVDQSGPFVASESLFRFGLVLALVGSVSTVLLAVALYVTVRPVDGNLALVALLFRICESAIGATGIAISFGILHLRSATVVGDAFAPGERQALIDVLTGVATTDVAAIFFSVGSTIFFALLLRSRYIPRVLAGIGLVGSACYAAMWIARLIWPGVSWVAPIASVPILIAEVAGGLWLLLRAINIPELADARYPVPRPGSHGRP